MSQKRKKLLKKNALIFLVFFVSLKTMLFFAKNFAKNTPEPICKPENPAQAKQQGGPSTRFLCRKSPIFEHYWRATHCSVFLGGFGARRKRILLKRLQSYCCDEPGQRPLCFAALVNDSASSRSLATFLCLWWSANESAVASFFLISCNFSWS